MYAYTDFRQKFVRQGAAQYRDHLQRHASLLRLALPYGELSAAQLRALAHIASRCECLYAHLTTEQNVQFNWIPLDRSAEVMDHLASVVMHGIQTSGNCIHMTTSDCGLQVEVYRPQQTAVVHFLKTHGETAMYDSIALRKARCSVDQTEPLSSLLAIEPAWARRCGGSCSSAPGRGRPT